MVASGDGCGRVESWKWCKNRNITAVSFHQCGKPNAGEFLSLAITNKSMQSGWFNICASQFITGMLSLAAAQTDLGFYLRDRLFNHWANLRGNIFLLHNKTIPLKSQKSKLLQIVWPSLPFVSILMKHKHFAASWHHRSNTTNSNTRLRLF